MSDDLLERWLARRVTCAAGCGNWALRGNSVTEICSFCRMRIVRACSTLSHNLAVAAGLCRAFRLGGSATRSHIYARQDNKYADPDPWSPGCGREAPR